MGFSLKKWFEEAASQVNPFDGGKTAATVRASRQQAQPAVTTRKSTMSVGNATPSRGLSVGAPNRTPAIRSGNRLVSQSPTMTNGISRGTPVAKPNQSFGNKLRDILDANTEADKYRRYQGNLKATTQEEVKPITLEDPGNVISNTIGAVPRTLNTMGVQGNELLFTAQQGLAGREYGAAVDQYRKAVALNDPTAIAQAKNRMSGAANRVQDIERRLAATKGMYRKNKGGLFNAGTVYDEADSYKGDLGTGIRKIGGNTAEAALDVASLGLTSVTGKQLAKQGFKQGLRSSAGIVGKNAAVNAGQGAASAYREGGNATDIAKAALLSGTLGTVADVGLAGAGAGLYKIAGPTKRAIKGMNADLGQGGYVQVGPTPKKIHPDDMNVMAEYIDMARGVKGPATEARLIDLEYEADAIARRYGLTRPGETPSPAQLANKFDNRLMTEHYGKTQPEVQSKPKKKSIWNDQGGYIRIPGKNTELMVTHNLSADNLAKAQQMGGIPQASIGIVDPKKSVIDGYGDITLVGNNRLVDPKAPKTKTYASDVYSPRQPRGEYQVDRNGMKALGDKFAKEFKETGDEIYNLEARRIEETMQDSPAVMAAYLKERKVKPDLSSTETDAYYKKRAIRNNLRKQIIDLGAEPDFNGYVRQNIEELGATSKLYAGTTASGTPRYIDDNIDNALKLMRKESKRGGDNTGGVGRMRSQVTPAFKSIDDIVKAKNRLTDTQTMEATKELLESKLNDVQASIDKYAVNRSDNRFTEFDAQMEAITDYIGGDTRWFKQKFPGAPESVIKKLEAFKKELQDAPTEYFESVSDRAVRLNEFEKALIPEGLPKAQREAIVDRLRAEGIQPVFYKQGKRQEALTMLMEQDNAPTARPEPSKNQGGYVKNPFYKDNPVTEGLSKKQSEFINDYAEMLEGMGSKNGVDITPDGRRISNNFRDADTAGKRMTKYDWFEKARKDIESGKAWFGASEDYKALPGVKGAPTQKTPQPKSTLQDALQGKSTKVKELPNKPSGRMSKAEKESLYASAPPGTERTLKVQQPNNGSNVPVSKVTQQGDVVTKTNVNPNIKKGEKRFSLDDKGDLIPDQNGAYRLFTDDDGKVTGFRVGDKYYSAKDFGDLSDVNDYGSALATQRRNVERAFGKETGEKVNQFLVDHQQAQATKMIERQLEFSKGLDSLKKELGISFKIGRHRAKKVSAAIQDYGEGKIRKPELIEQFGKDQADKIVKADKWFRNQYDTLLDEMNDTLVKYGYDPVPKRKNYYTHFQEPSLWQSFGLKMQELKNMSSPTMQDALPDAPRGSISNKLAGQSEYLQPNKKFNQFALQRKGDLHKADAFGAFERYLNPTLNNIYMTPSITRARVISRAIAQEADLAGKDANGILIQTREWANSLAGKSNRWGDRQLSDSKFGRKYLKATQWAQKMAGQNTIVGNLSTAVMQPIVLQQTVGKFGIKNTILGLMQEMGPAHSKNAPIRKSPFMNRRYSKFESATAGKIDAARGIANKPLEVVEETAARVTWNAAHNDALSQGLTGSKAIRYADINAEKTLAGRAIGEKPEMFRSKTAAPLTMYQLEVNNFWQQFGKEMTKTQAAKTMVAAYGLNLVLQEITGRQVGFNPVDAAIDSYQETQKEDKTTGQKAITIAQRAAGEVVDNTPFVGPVMNTIVGDKGVKGMTGNDSNTGKFGVGSPLSALTNTTKVEVGDKEIPVPLNAILPFGGAQVKKTYEGWKALQDGGLDDKNDKRLVDIPQSAENTAKGLVFGKGAIPEVNQYYENIGKKKADQKPVQNQTNSRASKMGPAGSGNDPKDIYAAAFNSKEGQAMLALGTDKEREEQYPELFKDYKAMKTAFEYDRTKYRPDNYDKLSNDSKAIYDKLGSLTDEAQDKWLKRTASGSSEKVYNSLNAIKPKDYPGLPKTNEVAKMYADFESDQKENNWTGTRLESEKKKLVRSAYETILNDNEKYILSANTDDTLAMVENGEVDKDTMDKLVQYDDMMIALGGSARISKTVRGKLGYSAATTKSYSSGSRSGSSTKIAKGKYSLADLLSSVQSTNKTLRQLLEQTLKG